MTEHVGNAAWLKYLCLVGGVEYMHVYDGCLLTCCYLFACCLSVYLLFVCLPIVCPLACCLSVYLLLVC